MASWAEETVEKLQHERNQEEAALIEDRLRRAQQPYVWAELRDWIKKNCGELNELAGRMVLSFDVSQNSEATVQRLDDRGRRISFLRVKYDADAARIRYECGTGCGEFIFQASCTDSSVTLHDGHRHYLNPDEAGRRLLDLLMRSAF